MCSSQTISRSTPTLDIAYISNAEEFVQHLMAVFLYLVHFPMLGNYEDEYDGHIVYFDDLQIIFYSPEI